MPSSKSIKDSLKESLSLSEDVIHKELHSKKKRIEGLYIKTICDEKVFQQKLIIPFYEIEDSIQFLAYPESHPLIKPFDNQPGTLEELLRGVTILLSG